MTAVGSRGPFSSARRADLSPPLFALQGGRINFVFNATSGAETRFKGRYLQRFTARPPVDITPAWFCWRAAANNATPELAMPNDVPMTAVAAVIYDTDATTPLGSVAAVTKDGNASFTIPAGIDTFMADILTPASFGLDAFPANGFLEWRALYDLPSGHSAPGIQGSGRPGQAQMQRGTPAQLSVNDVMSTGFMNSGGASFISMFMPVALGRFRGTPRAALLVGDSLTERTWDYIPQVGVNPAGGGGLFARACLAADVPFFNAGAAGRTANGAVLSPKTLALGRHAKLATTCFGANDVAGTLPGGAAGQPVTVDYMAGQNKAVWSSLRSYGVGRIVAATSLPRLADNNYKCTDLAQMTPYLTSATIAGGAPSNGYGFGSGETNEQWRSALLALAGAADGPDAVFDSFGTLCDRVTSWKIKLHPFTATLAGNLAMNASSAFMVAAPDLYATMVFEPGVANVDGVVNANAMQISGSGPYTVTMSINDPYSNTLAFGVPTKAHASGTAVRGTWCIDGTHPGTEFYRVNAPALAAMF